MNLRLTLLLFLLAGLAGCKPDSNFTGVPPAQPTSASRTIKAAVVTDSGGIDDKSFNAAAWAGLQRAEKEFDIPAKFLESRDPADYKGNLSALAEQGNDLVFAVGYMMEDALKEVAPTYPNTKFVIIDGSAPNLPNCAAIKFREEEGAFLAGYLSGRMTKSGALAFVGGQEGPVLKRFEVGYIAGARTARPDIRVIPKWVDSWTDVEKGKELAITAMDQGADIVFAAAGRSGLGALDAVQERGAGYYGIGVDKDQDGLHPGRILTSMMKSVDGGVYETARALKDGRWQPGDRVLGLKEGGVHLSPMTYTKKDVPPDVLAELDEVSKMINDGKIKPPTTDEELQNFLPPKL